MSEPLIPNPVPVVKPAVPAKTFDKIYIPRTEINALPNQPWNCKIVIAPFDGDAEILKQFEQIEIKDIKACAALSPALAAAMAAMLDALGTIAVAAKASNKKTITPENIVSVLASIQP